MLGHELIERIKDQGLVVKDWVDQGEILAHRAIGGFVSHGGWNPLVEPTPRSLGIRKSMLKWWRQLDWGRG